MTECVNVLKEWTGKASATVLFDGTVDELNHAWLFDKVKGRQNIAVVAFTTDGDVFGGFYSVAVTEQTTYMYDPNIFVFSFESHGRCATPQRFVVKEGLKKNAYVCFWTRDDFGFVQFSVLGGYGGFTLGNERSKSCCQYLSRGFEGLQDTTLTGNVHHHCTRLVAIQLE